jgi:POT family proton-dependent oligopeptide transporter
VQFASALGILFTFLAYVMPLFGAYIADTRLGRYKTIVVGVIIGGVAHVIMIGGAAPSLLRAGKGIAPFMISFFLLAIGAGIFKPNVAPTVIDQYTHQFQYTKVLKSGEKVIVDPERTIQRIMLVFYAMINIGAFFSIATTYTEKYVGYWVAFLEPGIVYFLLPVVLAVVYNKTIKRPPMGSELTEFIKIAWTVVKVNKGRFWAKDFWEKAMPDTLAERGVHVTWSEKAVDDVRRTFHACAVFLYFPVYNINDGGVGAVASNQGAAMMTNGAPNDLLSNFNPLTIIVFTPIMTYGVYPLLAKYRIKFGPIARMTVGFLLAATSGVIGGIVQYRVYKTSPCGYQASTCDATSPLSIWWQIPNVSLGAISEVFCNVTAYEMAYVRAPPHLKAVVMAMFLFTNALSSALGEILVPSIVDPHLIVSSPSITKS